MSWFTKKPASGGNAEATARLQTITLEITCSDEQAAQVQADLRSLIQHVSAEDIHRLAKLMADPLKRKSARSALYSNT